MCDSIVNETKTDFPSYNNEVVCIKGEVFREYFMHHFGIQGFNVLGENLFELA